MGTLLLRFGLCENCSLRRKKGWGNDVRRCCHWGLQGEEAALCMVGSERGPLAPDSAVQRQLWGCWGQRRDPKSADTFFDSKSWLGLPAAAPQHPAAPLAPALRCSGEEMTPPPRLLFRTRSQSPEHHLHVHHCCFCSPLWTQGGFFLPARSPSSDALVLTLGTRWARLSLLVGGSVRRFSSVTWSRVRLGRSRGCVALAQLHVADFGEPGPGQPQQSSRKGKQL